jgi:hypothetical protein
MWRGYQLALSVCALSIAAFPQSPPTQEFQQSYLLAASEKVFVRNLHGNVRITAWDRSEVKVDAIKRADTAAHLSSAEVVVERQSEGLCIASKYAVAQRPPKEWFGIAADPCRDPPKIRAEPGDLATVDYAISVPRNAELTVLITKGDVDVQGTAGRLFVDIDKGHLTARDVSGDCKLFGSYSGVNVILSTLAHDARIESAVGPLVIYIAPEVSARIRARSGRGRVNNDFGWAQPPHQDLQASMGAAKVTLDVTSHDGEIEIRRLQPTQPGQSASKKPASPASRKKPP